MRLRYSILLCFVFCLTALPDVRGAAPVRDAVKPLPEYSRVARRFAEELPREHVSRLPLDDTMSARGWTNFLSALDYDRIYFLASDISVFAREQVFLDDELKAGDVDFAYRVFEVFKSRVRERCEFVNRLLDKEFDLTVDESYVFNRKDASWPKDASEQDDLWRRRVKNEYIQRVLAEEMADKAVSPESVSNKPPEKVMTPAESVRSRYKQFMTVIEDSDADWVLQRYLSAVAHGFDPHSDYMSPSVLEDFNIEMKLSLVGIGALLGSEDGAAKIMKIIPGGPADRDKRDIRLMPGDKIIAVANGNGVAKDILHLPLREIVKLIRGKKGTTAVLTVIPASDPTGSTTKIVDLVRDEVKLEEEAAKERVEVLPLSAAKKGSAA